MPRFAKRAICALAAATAAALGATAHTADAAPMTVSVDPASAGRPVPGDFLGLSYEIRALPDIASFATKGNMVQLLRSLGHGVVRFGGITADSQTAWVHGGRRRPDWANSTVGADDLASLGQLVRAAGWRALLTVNLGHFDPSAAADEMAIARADLGDTLAGVQIGNEPNSLAAHGLRDEPWGFDQYRADVDAYLSAINGTVPGIPLAGPSASSGHADWLYAEAAALHPALLTAHFYSLGCHSHFRSDVRTLLSTTIRQRMDKTVTRFGWVTQGTRIPLRIAETNNVSCGGRIGVSDSFASALWATDLMIRSIHAGLGGVNFHGSIYNCHGYTPLCAPTNDALANGTLQVQPEWYALLLVRQLLGDRPLRSFIRGARPKVDVIALLAPGGRLHFVVVNELPHHVRPVPLRLHVPRRYKTGTILRLTARLPTSTTGVKLGGRTVASDGTWHSPASLPRVTGKRGELELEVPAGSAALVTLR